MQKESVDLMLGNYREYTARCEFLEQEIRELERIAADLRRTMITDALSGSQNLSGMPHGTSVSSPTERIAIKFADGYVPDYIVDIEKEIASKKDELCRKTPTVVFVTAWLKGLSEKERFVIESKTIGGAFWRELIYAYQQRFGEVYSKQGLKKIRDRALEKIYRIAT